MPLTLSLQLLFLSAGMALVCDLWYGSTSTECWGEALAAGGMSINLKYSDCHQTLTLPKPLVEFANKPMIEHQVENLAAAGVTDIVLAVNYRPEVMAAALKKVCQGFGFCHWFVEHGSVRSSTKKNTTSISNSP